MLSVLPPVVALFTMLAGVMERLGAVIQRGRPGWAAKQYYLFADGNYGCRLPR